MLALVVTVLLAIVVVGTKGSNTVAKTTTSDGEVLDTFIEFMVLATRCKVTFAKFCTPFVFFGCTTISRPSVSIIALKLSSVILAEQTKTFFKIACLNTITVSSGSSGDVLQGSLVSLQRAFVAFRCACTVNSSVDLDTSLKLKDTIFVLSVTDGGTQIVKFRMMTLWIRDALGLVRSCSRDGSLDAEFTVKKNVILSMSHSVTQ